MLAATVSPRSRRLPEWLANLVVFQTGWWAVVLTAAQGRPMLGVVVVLLALAWHHTRIRPGRWEVLLVTGVAMLGFLIESGMQATGWVSYAGAHSDIAPLWMVALWANFAITLNVSMRPLRSRPGMAVGLGALGGPAAYWGGAQMGAMNFHDPVSGLLALTLIWALATPALLALAGVLERRGP
jgi:hypothetical protein